MKTYEMIMDWLLVAVFMIGFLLIRGNDVWRRQTDKELDNLAIAYANSQYIKGEQAIQKIDDSTLYLYAGLAYWRGEDPTTINFEHPPVGKYIFGAAQALFGNVLALNMLVLCLILIVMMMMMQKLHLIFWLKQLGLIFVALGLALDQHLLTGLLDSQLLLLTLIFFYFLLFFKKEGWVKYITLGIILGLLMSTKYYIPAFGAYLLIFGWWVWQKKHMVWLF